MSNEINMASNSYYHQKASVQEYITMAQGVNGAGLIKELSHYLPQGATLLELGSGPGSDFELLSQLYSVTGSDYSEEFLLHLHQRFANQTFLHLDATTLLIDKTFDGIYANKVLQHLTDEALEQSIKRQAEIVSPNGIICHSFWNGTGDELFKGLLVNYQNKESLQRLFSTYFDTLHCNSYTEFEPNDSILFIGKLK